MAELFNVSMSVLDDDGNTTSYAVKVPAGTLTLAEIREFAQEFCAAVDLVTEVQITSLRVSLEAALPAGIKSSPVASSNIQEGALFSFIAADTSYKYGSRVPGFDQSKFVGREVDDTDTDVQAFLNAMILGLDASGTTVQPSDNYANDLTAYAKAIKSFRR